jgi:hypothetical protein
MSLACERGGRVPLTLPPHRPAPRPPAPRMRASLFLSSDVTIAILSIVIVGGLAYWLFFVPAIFMDDWTSVLERVVTGNARWFDLQYRNPLLFTPFLVQQRLFQLNVSAYYAVIWLLGALTTLLLYLVVVRFPLPERRSFGLVVAMLFWIYPTNYTHMWMIQLGIYCGTVLAFLYGYSLLRFAAGARWPTLALALMCLLLSFGFYEGQVGVVAAWALILALLYRRAAVSRIAALLTPILLAGIFSAWRTLGFQSAGIEDQYLSRVVVTPDVLLSRLLLGYKVSLAWGWTYSIEQFIPWASGAKAAGLLLMLSMALAWFSFDWFRSRAGAVVREATMIGHSRTERLTLVRPYAVAAVIGVALIGAGYIPVVLVYLPSLSGIGSRHNGFATIGSAVFVGSVLMAGALLCSRDLQRMRYQVLASAMPLVLIGIVTQASVQYHNRLAWREQQHIWGELFLAAPDIKDNTMVLFVLPGYQDRTGFYNWRRTPLSASWEVSSGVRLLYDNFTLSGDVYFPDIEEPIEPALTAGGVFIRDTNTMVPYSRAIAFSYDNRAGKLNRIDEIPAEWVEGTDHPLLLCDDCVLDGARRNIPIRALVQDE